MTGTARPDPQPGATMNDTPGHAPDCDRSLDAVLICAACASQVELGPSNAEREVASWAASPVGAPAAPAGPGTTGGDPT